MLRPAAAAAQLLQAVRQLLHTPSSSMGLLQQTRSMAVVVDVKRNNVDRALAVLNRWVCFWAGCHCEELQFLNYYL